jgi:hypothetical protein
LRQSASTRSGERFLYFTGTTMNREVMERSRHWRATAEYHGSRGLSVACLMADSLIEGQYYWFLTQFRGVQPWGSVRAFDAGVTACLVLAGKLRLLKGEWPAAVSRILQSGPTVGPAQTPHDFPSQEQFLCQ